jgi:hypothetical protein
VSALSLFRGFAMLRFRRTHGWSFGVSRRSSQTITFYDDAENGVARLLAVTHRTVSNPAYRQEES